MFLVKGGFVRSSESTEAVPGFVEHPGHGLVVTILLSGMADLEVEVVEVFACGYLCHLWYTERRALVGAAEE